MKPMGEGAPREHPAAARPRIRLAAALSILVILVSIAGCALEEYVIFEPPINYSSASEESTQTFQHNTANDSSYFYGYEVVYRLYDDIDDAESDASYIESSWSSSTPDTIHARLANRDFVSVVRSDDLSQQSSPVFRIDDDNFYSTIVFTLSFGTTDASSINIDNSITTTFTLERNAKDSGGSYYTFAEDENDFAPGDDCEYSETSPEAVYLLVYAYAYGLDDDFSAIYSLPVRLGIAGIELK